jgi:uncharacterized protein (DUF2252 family)
MLTFDPVRLARRQIELDRKRTAQFPHLLAHKTSRMVVSPLALLRGSAPMFYDLLERHPALAEGPPGTGWLVGDAHLENFGAYRAGALAVTETQRSHALEGVVFDLNDFDDAFIGPWRLDVLRLTTSLVLGGREIGVDGRRALELCDALLASYVDTVFHRKRPPPVPAVVTALVEKVRQRTRRELLDARTEVVRGVRRFVDRSEASREGRTRLPEVHEEARARGAPARRGAGGTRRRLPGGRDREPRVPADRSAGARQGRA